MHHRLAVAAALALLFALAGAHAEVYKWTDDEGVTHYTAQPPPSEKAKVLDPAVGSPDDSPDETNASEEQNAAADEDTQSVASYCKKLREQIKTLESDRPVKIRTGEDSLKELNDDEREQRLTEARTQLEEQCS